MELTRKVDKFDLPDEAFDEVLSLIQSARNNGHTDELTINTIIGYIAREHTNIKWSEVGGRLDEDYHELIQKKRKLLRTGIISESVRYPSDFTFGEPAMILQRAERKHPTVIFNGTSPLSWVEGAWLVRDWINLTDGGSEWERQGEMEQLLGLDSTAAYYGDIASLGDGSLGRLLAQRRYSAESLRIATGETTKRIRERLGSLREYNEDYYLHETERAGRIWYWTSGQG